MTMSRRLWPNPKLRTEATTAGRGTTLPVIVALDEPEADILELVLDPIGPDVEPPFKAKWCFSADPDLGIRLEVTYADDGGGNSDKDDEQQQEDEQEDDPKDEGEGESQPDEGDADPADAQPDGEAETDGEVTPQPAKPQIVWQQKRSLTFPTVREEGRQLLVEVDSIAQLLYWAEKAPQVWEREPTSREENSHRTNWTGTETFEEALSLARNGWPEGRELMEKVLEAYRPKAYQRPIPKTSWDVAGATPDVPRYVAGAPDAMIPPDDMHAEQKPIVRLVVHITYAAVVSPQAIINWGAAMVSHIHKMEEAGLQVEVTGVWYSTPSERAASGGPHVAIRFPLKAADQQLNLDRLAFWLAHPSSLRRIEFSCMERMDVERWYHCGYGRATQSYHSPDGREIVLWGEDGARSVEDGIAKIGRRLMAKLPHDIAQKIGLVNANK